MSVFLFFLTAWVKAEGYDNFNAIFRLYAFILGLIYDITFLTTLFN